MGRLIALLGIIFLMLMSSGALASDGESRICLGCHGEKGLTKTMTDGSQLSLHADSRALSGSVHSGLGCADCHVGYSAENHPQRQFKSIRAFKTSASAACGNCHSPGGVHKRMLTASKGVICIDCHGAHSVKSAAEPDEIANPSDSCLGCHKNGVTIAFGNGESEHMKIEIEDLKVSVHGRLRCYDCHFGFSREEHPQMRFKSRRDLTIIASEGCRRCHFDKYTKTLEGIHYDILSRGNMKAPVCVDCHGSHAISSGRKEKVLSARKCQKCHEDIYKIYSGSVHGSALISEHNQDVPICSDCHKAHDLADPHTADFRNRTPDTCGRCHADTELMAKYGLSTSVLRSYLEDFHGVTVTFYKKEKKAVRHIAVCTDCHGIHDITKVKGPNATMLKSNLLARCRKCHPNATENFPDSWISHYDPTFKRAPLVYAVTLTYKLFIPFMIVGLLLQIILHIWRYAVNR